MHARRSLAEGDKISGLDGLASRRAFSNQDWVNRGQMHQLLFPKAQILGAVVLAKSKIRRLVKSERNADDDYVFASIDRFLEHINPICVEAGLVVLMDEVGVADGVSGARQGQNSWLRITYDITLAHISGEMLGPFRRHVDIPRTGPQAFGAAQSYVLKQFLRAQFQIATGEADDPDFGAKARGREPAADRAEARIPQSDGAEADDHTVDIMELRTCAQRITEAASGRELLSLLSGLADDRIAHPMLQAARLRALTRIVSTAPSVAALEKLEHYFAIDWRHVSDEAVHRRLQLDLVDSLDEADCAAKVAQAATTVMVSVETSSDPLGAADHALSVAAPASADLPGHETPDALDFGNIPYQEAAE